MVNFKEDDYLNHNKLTWSGYKIYNPGFDNKFLLVEATLSNCVIH